MTFKTDIPPFLQRLYAERDDLAEKFEKGAAFRQTELFAGLDALDRTLLIVQLATMKDYLCLLNKRIARAEEKGAEKCQQLA